MSRQNEARPIDGIVSAAAAIVTANGVARYSRRVGDGYLVR
jgi:hypothetical protein